MTAYSKLAADAVGMQLTPALAKIGFVRAGHRRLAGVNNKARLITRRAYGFPSPRTALALIHLTCGPITLTLPHQKSA